MTPTYHSILVHFDGGAQAAPRLRQARAIAARFGARLTTLFAVSARFVVLPVPGRPVDAPLLDEVDPASRRHAKAHFHAVEAEGDGGAGVWEEVATADPVAGVAVRAVYADLMVLGHADPDDVQARDVPNHFAESVVIASGTPALVLPRRHAAMVSTFPVVLIAWRPTAEAGRALRAALPLLGEAREVHLASWSGDARECQQWLDDATAWLAARGIAPVRRHGHATELSSGEELLRLAAQLGADLLVMGCYGHDRRRELVLGGVSRTVLRDASLPLLIAH
jgi:nucleotide-binding universal stress UspA family protein